MFIVLDRDGEVAELVARERLDSHRLIEECMLAANESAAKFLNENHQKTAGMYRIHTPPEEKKIEELIKTLSLLGIPIDFELNTAKDFEKAILVLEKHCQDKSLSLIHI